VIKPSGEAVQNYDDAARQPDDVCCWPVSRFARAGSSVALFGSVERGEDFRCILVRFAEVPVLTIPPAVKEPG
jgi:hypothetical protein